jgi:hypothetical protein
VAFLKFSRDKRGYEHFALVQPSSRGRARPRVLYWFRTPPNVKVGRAPFDPDIQRALETCNPDIVFDWKAIVHAPVPPPPEAERWRERRRIERAMRSAAATEGDEADEPAESATPGVIEAARLSVDAAAEPIVDVPVVTHTVEAQAEPRPAPTVAPLSTSNTSATSPSTSATPAAEENPGTPPGGGAGRRRRRRQRRGGRRQGTQEVQGVQEVREVQEVQQVQQVQEGSGPERPDVDDEGGGDPEDGV